MINIKQAFLALMFVWACEAFTALPRFPAKQVTGVRNVPIHSKSRQVGTPLYAEQEETSAEEATAQSQGDSPAEDVVEEEAVESVPEDPEVTALKQEISDLESALRAKKSQLDAAQDQAELYSKAGYTRKVAEMENMRRLRSSLNSSSKEAAMASVLVNFLPMLDSLHELRQKYNDDEFGSGYNALAGNMIGALKALGVEEYTAEVGEPVDENRHQVVGEEHSESISEGTVIRPVTMGIELQGNVLRMADCVVSLGSESGPEPPAEEEGEEGSAESEPEESAQ